MVAPSSGSSPSRPLDAVARSWVDRLPPALEPYARLMRLDRPIGTWLLYWPCAWSLLLGGLSHQPPIAVVGLLLLFFIGALVMRSAGCAYNDIVDRDIDASVARTRGRPLASGRLGLRQAWAVVIGLCLVGAGVLFSLSPTAIAVGLGALVLVAAYPFMKRITWWPQAWLGLTFNWGVLVGWAAVAPAEGPEAWAPALLLYAGGVAWTLGYDTIYALQDLEDDALAGVKSSARALGPARVRPAVALFYGFALLAWAAAIAVAVGAGWAALLVVPVAIQLGLQVVRLGPVAADGALNLFRSNHLAGALLALTCLIAGAVRG